MTGRYLGKLTGLGLCCAMALGAASAANATTTLTLNSYQMTANQNEIGKVHDTTSTPVISENAYIGPISLNMSVDGTSGAPFTFKSFCVDIFDDLKASGGWTISSGLSALNLGDIRSAQLTNLLYNADSYIASSTNGTGTSADRGTAMQIAIWEIINETSASSFNASSGNFYVDNLPQGSLAITDANALLSTLSSATAPSNFQVALVSASGNQTQVIYQSGAAGITGAIPEPATWGMMVLGFGAIGGALRRKKAPAAAIA